MYGIPLIIASGRGLPAAWENSIDNLLTLGCETQNQYEAGRTGIPPSLDSTMVIDVDDPMSEPMLHGFMPCGPEELQEYLMEICGGIKDHWVVHEGNEWRYTYHQRLAPQLPAMIEKLKRQPFTRQAQLVTWDASIDPYIYDPPCLQSIWVRIIDGVATASVRFRSRDALKAAFMNMFALCHFIRFEILDKVDPSIKFGKYIDISNSYHIYGQDRVPRPGGESDALIKTFMNCRGKTFSWIDDWAPMMAETIPRIMQKVRERDEQLAKEKAKA